MVRGVCLCYMMDRQSYNVEDVKMFEIPLFVLCVCWPPPTSGPSWPQGQSVIDGFIDIKHAVRYSADHEPMARCQDRLHQQHSGVCHRPHGVSSLASQCWLSRLGNDGCCESYRQLVLVCAHGELHIFLLEHLTFPSDCVLHGAALAVLVQGQMSCSQSQTMLPPDLQQQSQHVNHDWSVTQSMCGQVVTYSSSLDSVAC